MRLSAAISVVLALALMACAAYLGPRAWQLALYLDLLAWAVAVLLVLTAAVESRAPRGWVRATIAAIAGAEALAVSLGARPGSVPQFPFHDLFHSALAITALGFAAGALGLGIAALRADQRGSNLLAGVGMLLALVSLRGWLAHAS